MKNIVNIDRFFSGAGHHHSNVTTHPAPEPSTSETTDATRDLIDANLKQIDDLKAQIAALEDNKATLKAAHEAEIARLEEDIPN